VTRTHDASEVCRIHELTETGSILAASADGLFHSTTGADWRAVPTSADRVLSVAEHPEKPLLYAGTDPSMLVVADLAEGVPTGEDDWTAVSGFRELKAAHDWGIPRHDGRSKIRSIRTDPSVPERIVVGESWHRLDEGHRQQYFRESMAQGDVPYAGGAPGSAASWNDDTDHALFECHDGRQLERAGSPVEDEVVVG